jgi:Histidine kinase-, DNA gyrase B-, and HSP90-like ATPase
MLRTKRTCASIYLTSDFTDLVISCLKSDLKSGEIVRTIKVEVQPDHLSKLAAVRRPSQALCELIWNGLDADAQNITVTYKFNGLQTIMEILVEDDGHGIYAREADSAFEKLGGSWKKLAEKTRTKKRMLHGKEGRGRFKVFALGTKATWQTVYKDGGVVSEYSIVGEADHLTSFGVSDVSVVPTKKPGTKVRIEDIDFHAQSLQLKPAYDEINKTLALYLKQYPDVKVIVGNVLIDPVNVILRSTDYDIINLEISEGKFIDAKLTVIEWSVPFERSLCLCDLSGFTLDETLPGIQAPGFYFTAYLRSGFIRDQYDNQELFIGELNKPLDKLLNAAKDKLRIHFRQRTAEETLEQVAAWKREEVYPFDDQPNGVISVAERQVFDVVALNVNAYLPGFADSDQSTKKLQFSLIRQAIENGPSSLMRILADVIQLPIERQKDLVALLEKTSLSSIIKASKEIADRLNFVRGLEVLLFDAESRRALLERSQLHRILAQNTWIFGEEYNLTVNDQSLTEVLKKHLTILGEHGEVDDEVLRNDETRGIVDLMLSRRIPHSRDEEREHLIIELKRPSQNVNEIVLGQVKSYAHAVATDERFLDTNTKWVFWAISNDISPGVRVDANQADRQQGIVSVTKNPNITIWVKTWGQVIDECQSRLRFFQERLEYTADRDSALEHLRETHGRMLSNITLLNFENSEAQINNSNEQMN